MISASPATVEDRYGRRLRYLRLSVTDLCNLSCQYCNPVKGCAQSHHYKLSWDDLGFVADVAVRDLGVEAIRITGGEPTVRPGLTDWIASIRELPGLRDIAMTTNGMLLGKMSAALRDAGLRRVNVSLDSFNAEVFREVTRGGSLERCLDGISRAAELLERVKVNCVLLQGVNDHELEKFILFSHDKNIEVRFIELMPIFDQKEYFHRHFISVEEMKTRIAALGLKLEADTSRGYGPATTFHVAGTGARLGFISQMSDTKCLTCNKLRITADGALKACLLSPQEVDLVPLIAARDREAFAGALCGSFLQRAERYDLKQIISEPVSRTMQAIGG
ncbi:GTP 3',8-cyclase MoaA [Candidatus Sumerlaeota bacterium]|nr:GTP 3',8-cyclase MoaA [Candidatus Sumerlaeota bacterium]